MKKDDIPKISSVKGRGPVKNESKIEGARSQSAKTFLGCDTCKLKHNIPPRKSKPVQKDGQVQNQQNAQVTQNGQKMTIKLTDLCNEDKKRIVELMEELTKFSEKNRSLRESLDMSEKAKQEQYECLLMQTNLHLEEKNLFIKEIQTYKKQLETYDAEMKDKILKWELRERYLDNEIRHFAKALQKSMNEKNELLKEISHLKACLKQSLESFELLSNEVATLQRLSVKSTKSSSSSRCMTGGGETKELTPHAEESEDEFQSIDKDHPTNKNSLDMINSKLEALYALMQNKASDRHANVKSSVPEEDKLPQGECDKGVVEPEALASGEVEESKTQNALNRNWTHREGGDTKTHESNYKFLKPFDEYNKTSIQAERILRNMEKPFSFDRYVKLGSEKAAEALDDEDLGTSDTQMPRQRGGKRDSFHQSTSLDMLLEDRFNEDRLLSDLFYSDTMVDVGVEAALLLATRENFDHPYVPAKY